MESQRRELPEVALRRAARDLPPCPVCGAPLFGWLVLPAPARAGEGPLVRRCEECGVGVIEGAPAADAGARDPSTTVGDLEREPDPRAAIAGLAARLGPGRELRIRFRNRAGLQASLGGGRWAGVDGERDRVLLTPEALRRLLSEQGLVA